MPKLVIYLQAFSNTLHPISKAILTTALALSKEKHMEAVGVLCIANFKEQLLQNLENSGLTKCLIYKDTAFQNFIPEQQTSILCDVAKDAEILLFPATPEGRTLSSMVAAHVKTGVTADCTALSFTQSGFLLQTRPAFSGNLFASILTENTKPQIASLRFGTAVKADFSKTELEILSPENLPSVPYKATWLEKVAEIEKQSEIMVAVGNGMQKKEDITLFQKVAEKLGAQLYASRALIDKGFMPKQKQIGLSGQSVSPKFLVTFGISGSVQFLAGLQKVGTLCSVNLSPDAPILKKADLPIIGDMYAIANAILNA